MEKLVFFDFATLNYGGGVEKNFMNMGKYFAKNGFDISFVTANKLLNTVYTFISFQGVYRHNFMNKDIKKFFNVKKYSRFSLLDLFFPTKNRKNILNVLESANHIVSKNEFFEVLILKYVFKVKMEKVVFGFHTPIFYPVTKSLKSKIHNKLYNSNFYFNLLRDSKARLLTLTKNEQIIKKYKINPINVTVIPNPLDTKKFFQKEYKKGEKFQVYYVGRMVEAKGIDILYSAIISLSKKEIFNEIEFHFVGSGEYEYLLVRLERKFKNCFFHGFQENVVRFYHKADIVVVPSRWEGFPYAVLEAQSCGVPVITTDTSGCRDIVINGKTGWICQIDDEKEALRAIAKAFFLWRKNFGDFVSMGIRAREEIVLNYEENRINERIKSFLVS